MSLCLRGDGDRQSHCAQCPCCCCRRRRLSLIHFTLHNSLFSVGFFPLALQNRRASVPHRETREHRLLTDGVFSVVFEFISRAHIYFGSAAAALSRASRRASVELSHCAVCPLALKKLDSECCCKKSLTPCSSLSPPSLLGWCRVIRARQGSPTWLPGSLKVRPRPRTTACPATSPDRCTLCPPTRNMGSPRIWGKRFSFSSQAETVQWMNLHWLWCISR